MHAHHARQPQPNNPPRPTRQNLFGFPSVRGLRHPRHIGDDWPSKRVRYTVGQQPAIRAALPAPTGEQQIRRRAL
jgi:hypothetical protein